MTMTPIHWLRFITKVKTNIDGHYVLKIEEKFQVFTLKPINGIGCHKVSETNIRGKNQPQYLADPVHDYDCETHKLTQPNECTVYYAQHKKALSLYERNLKFISDSTDE